ncbi:TPA: hypothetical protein U1317_001422 [Streptococcus suis]|nr:hypothetical protein [Streptococcus suis]HEM5178162.1 hypothetical protein [Streptococcus suis]
MTKKMGRRPKNDEPMEKSLKVRMTEKMYDSILSYADKNNLSKTDVVRIAIEQFLG